MFTHRQRWQFRIALSPIPSIHWRGSGGDGENGTTP